MSGYIGTQPVPQATQTRDSFTATSGQTSFATGGYTPTFLDVFLNGVKLAAADYTASNGSDVVLATGATTGDILEVVAYTTFDTANVTGAADFTVTGSFTSQGIDDNANATAMTLDSSGNVGIGAVPESWLSAYTALQIGDAGSVVGSSDNSFVALGANAYLDSTNSRYEYINSDYASQYYQVDGTHVWRTAASGSADAAISWSEAMRIDSSQRVLIGTNTSFADANSDDLQISGSGDTGMIIKSGTSSYGSIYFGDGTSGDARNEGIVRYSHSNNSMELWTSASRKLSINTSGDVTIHDGNLVVASGHGIDFSATASTGTSELLDDYEEGTWTPSIALGGLSVSTVHRATYVKVGQSVSVATYFTVGGTGDNQQLRIGGLPYASASNGYSVGMVDFNMGGKAGAYNRVTSSNTYTEVLYSGDSPSTTRFNLKGNQVGTGYVIVSLTYHVA